MLKIIKTAVQNLTMNSGKGTERSKLNVRQHFFSQQVLNSFSRLSNVAVTATTLNAFKNGLSKERYNVLMDPTIDC